MPPDARRGFARARVGHFATSDGRRPSLVPVCFVLLGDTVYHAVDAKPKSVAASRLRRVANIRANPNAALLVDHYEEDWSRLWFSLARGRARLIIDGVEHRRAIVALRRKYAQYRSTLPLTDDALVIALDVRQVSRWVSAGRRPRAKAAPPRARRSGSRVSQRPDRHIDRRS